MCKDTHKKDIQALETTNSSLPTEAVLGLPCRGRASPVLAAACHPDLRQLHGQFSKSWFLVAQLPKASMWRYDIYMGLNRVSISQLWGLCSYHEALGAFGLVCAILEKSS